MISKVVENTRTSTTKEETFSYDAAGNLTQNYSEKGQNCYEYGSYNRLTYNNGYYVSYDKDGNITSVVLGGSRKSFTYDSTNKLISAGQNAYTYNAENVRVKNLCGGVETSYVYDTNAKLSKLLVKKTGTTVTKYVYGRGLIGEETSGTFRTYHFDYRGSTVALTNINGAITDTFEYDTYGKFTHRTGSTKILFMYNGRDGVVTDDNGLIYMRARYYSPELRRFVNADIIAGEITNAITLNRYAYANANPVSFVDPKGLSVEEKGAFAKFWDKTKSFAKNTWTSIKNIPNKVAELRSDLWSAFEFDVGVGIGFGVATDVDVADVSALMRYDLISIKKDAGSTEVKIGITDEAKFGVGAFFAELFTGYKELESYEGEVKDEETYEPEFDFSSGIGGSAYLLIGGTATVGINWGMLLENYLDIEIY